MRGMSGLLIAVGLSIAASLAPIHTAWADHRVACEEYTLPEGQHCEYVPSADGTQIFLTYWRPPGTSLDDPTPVVMTGTPYAALRFPEAVIWNQAAQARFLARGWTYVQVSARGTFQSGGCSDVGGPIDKQDVAIVDWVQSQSWSNGRVASYGLSAEGAAQVVGIGEGAALEAAVIASPLVTLYDVYYDGGVPYLLSTDFLPTSLYLQASASHAPVDFVEPCATAVEGIVRDDPNDPFWPERDWAPAFLEADVPVLLAHGFYDTLIHSDYLSRVVPGLPDGSHVVIQQSVHDIWRRPDQLDEVMTFLAHHLEDDPAPSAPAVRVQDNDGRWRAETTWPPADAVPFSLELRPGSFGPGVGGSYGAVDPGALWTFLSPQPGDAHLSGAGSLSIDVAFEAGPTAPRLVATVYDVAPDGTAAFLTRGAVLLRSPGSHTLDLHELDWILREGHRLGVALSGSEEVAYTRTNATADVTVNGAALTLPRLTFRRDRFTDGGVPHGTVVAASTSVSQELIDAASVAGTVPGTALHPCASDPGRQSCPAYLQGSRAAIAEETTLLDTTVTLVQNPPPFDLFVTAFVPISVPDVPNARDLTVLVTPDRPAVVDVGLEPLPATGRELVHGYGFDVFGGGLVFGGLEPGDYDINLWGGLGLETGQGGGPAPNVRIQAILRSGADADDDVVACDSIDDSDPAISYRRGWHRRRDDRASNGAYHRRMGSHNTETGNASTPTATVRFQGDSIVYHYVRSDRGGSARISVDGEVVELLAYGSNQPGPENPTFGHERTYDGFGPGEHELVIEHLYGAVYLDGFAVPCEAGSAMVSESAAFGSETQLFEASGTSGPVVELPVTVGENARHISVNVEGGGAPVLVEILDPLGGLIGSGDSLMGGPASGASAELASPGTHLVRITSAIEVTDSLEVSVALTIERP